MKVRNAGLLVALLSFALIIYVGFSVTYNMGESRDREQMEFIRQAIERAAVQCYALEGAYPPDVSYLEENYGVVIDHSRYLIDYTVEGSNLFPSVFVFRSFDSASGMLPPDEIVELE